jgi:ABC-type transporter Mla subunit MlaD
MMIVRSARWTVLTIGVAVRLAWAASDLPLTIDVENSKGLKAGDSVVFEGKLIGRVDDVGFGSRDTVEIRVTIDAAERGRIHESGAFVVNDPLAGRRPNVEYFVIDARSPLAEPNARFQGLRSVAEVWMRRGRISADELSRAMAQGVEQFRRNLEELRRSPEWAKFKEQVARLSAQLTATGAALTQLLGEQLPKLQKELDDLYAEYQKELEKARRERTPAPQP